MRSPTSNSFSSPLETHAPIPLNETHSHPNFASFRQDENEFAFELRGLSFLHLLDMRRMSLETQCPPNGDC